MTRRSTWPPTSSSSRRARTFGNSASGPPSRVVISSTSASNAAGNSTSGLLLAPIGDFEDPLLQLAETDAAIRLDRHDRHAEVAFESGDVDFQAEIFRDIHHVESDDDGDAEVEELRRQIQVAFEVRRIDDRDDQVRLVLAVAENDVDGQHLVGAAGREAVGAGQIDDVERAPVMPTDSLLRLDGDAGIVADALVHAGELVEQRRLAGVRIADEGDGERLGESHWGRLVETAFQSWKAIPSYWIDTPFRSGKPKLFLRFEFGEIRMKFVTMTERSSFFRDRSPFLPPPGDDGFAYRRASWAGERVRVGGHPIAKPLPLRNQLHRSL